MARLLVTRAVWADVGAHSDRLDRDGRPRVDEVCELDADLCQLWLLDVLETEQKRVSTCIDFTFDSTNEGSNHLNKTSINC